MRGGCTLALCLAVTTATAGSGQRVGPAALDRIETEWDHDLDQDSVQHDQSDLPSSGTPVVLSTSTKPNPKPSCTGLSDKYSALAREFAAMDPTVGARLLEERDPFGVNGGWCSDWGDASGCGLALVQAGANASIFSNTLDAYVYFQHIKKAGGTTLISALNSECRCHRATPCQCKGGRPFGDLLGQDLEACPRGFRAGDLLNSSALLQAYIRLRMRALTAESRPFPSGLMMQDPRARFLTQVTDGLVPGWLCNSTAPSPSRTCQRTHTHTHTLTHY